MALVEDIFLDEKKYICIVDISGLHQCCLMPGQIKSEDIFLPLDFIILKNN